MSANLATKLIDDHLVEGNGTAGDAIGLRIDQTLTQDATGTLVMLELESMGLDRVKTKCSAQYVDHNLLQEDARNPEDHLFLQSACSRFGVWYSRPGNGVSHPLHQAMFGVPGESLLGSDSHTCAAGALGMLAIGTGGMDVALAMAGEPYRVNRPEIWGIRLEGELPDWCSAKDVILEMLRRHSVKGGVGRIVEYHGPGVATLSVMDRHVIANMGAELGATATVFPSDGQTKEYLEALDRGDAWKELAADDGAAYDHEDTIDLSKIVPLIAMPSSPDNVVPVTEVEGKPIYQAYIGSSANPGYADMAVAAHIVKGHLVHPQVSFDINPTSRDTLEALARDLHLNSLIHAGARLHQAGCNGCIGMGQAPATGKLSLRTVPRNFKGRSGTADDQVCLCSPETAAASALNGEITDPRTIGVDHPRRLEPNKPVVNPKQFQEPAPENHAAKVKLVKGANIVSLPHFDPLPNSLEVPVIFKADDNVSTDDILPAGAAVLPYRSNIPKISEFVFHRLCPEYTARACERQETGHAIAGGVNYGQGSSREHAALAARYLGLRAVIAKSFARIHRQNLVNWGVLPVTFSDEDGYKKLKEGDVLRASAIREQLTEGRQVTWTINGGEEELKTEHLLSPAELDVLFAGGLINSSREVLAD